MVNSIEITRASSPDKNQINSLSQKNASHFRDSLIGVLLIVLGVSLVTFSKASAQTQSFDEFKQKVLTAAGEIARYQELLTNPDIRIQYEAVKLMLKSKDAALERIAKEHALFSTHPVLQKSAVKAIFDSAPNLRVVVTSTGESSKDVMRWITTQGGSHDGRTGSFIFKVGEAKDNCWLHYRNYCRLRLAGTAVQFQNFGNQLQEAQASLALGRDGVLRGKVFSKNGGQANMSIDLKE